MYKPEDLIAKPFSISTEILATAEVTSEDFDMKHVFKLLK